jgi:signal transduction histidine kinase
VQRGTEAALSITDEGQGLTQEEIASLFRRFTRAPGSRGKGTGLGLYINKRLLEAQGGHIEIQSQKGIGSTFTVLLPRKPLPSTPDSKTGA